MKVLNFDGTIYEARTGSATQPSISFAGDTNTGIYNSGADELSIATGGVQRLVVDASGNVTIPGALTAGSLSGPSSFSLGSAASPSVYFGTDTNTGLYSPGADQVAISTGGTGRLFITSAGLVGIGTSAPSNILHVHSGAVGTSTLLESTGSGSYLGIKNSSGQWTLGATTTSFILENSGGTALTVDSSRRVGIGTTSPGYALHVSGTGAVSSRTFATDATGDASFFVQNDGNGICGPLVYGSTKTAYGALASNETAFYSNRSTTIMADGGSTVIKFATGGNTERARIDSSGRLLVGTSSARSNVATVTPGFQIEGLTNNSNRYSGFIYNAADVGGPEIHFAKSRGTAIGSNTVVADGDQIGTVNFEGADGTNFIVGAQIRAFVDGTPGANDMPGRLVFSTTAGGASTPTERMRLRNNGELWIHSSGGNPQFLITSTVNAGTITRLISGRYSGGTIGTGTESFRVYTNGDVQNTNNSYGSISDIKLKENIVDANSQWDDIKALQVRNYNFKEGQTHTQIGLVAQEVELVSPGLVSESPDRDEDGNDLGTVTKSVNYSVLYMKAVKALQEAMERIETLEAKVAALESA